jgi:hypothetical protein
MSKTTVEIKWNGDQLAKASQEMLEQIMVEFGLVAEGEAKKELHKGHGVLTGTLRRSIHIAEDDYDYGQDNVEPSASSPERGGKPVKVTRSGRQISISLGSGLSYALSIHQGWGKFAGYHYLENGTENAKKQLDAIIGRHQIDD